MDDIEFRGLEFKDMLGVLVDVNGFLCVDLVVFCVYCFFWFLGCFGIGDGCFGCCRLRGFKWWCFNGGFFCFGVLMFKVLFGVVIFCGCVCEFVWFIEFVICLYD